MLLVKVLLQTQVRFVTITKMILARLRIIDSHRLVYQVARIFGGPEFDHRRELACLLLARLLPINRVGLVPAVLVRCDYVLDGVMGLILSECGTDVLVMVVALIHALAVLVIELGPIGGLYLVFVVGGGQ